MEKQRLVWSTYNNINIWFEQMKTDLIDLGFARDATPEDGNKDEVGELIFFDGQLDRILNIDKSEVTTDGTSKLTMKENSMNERPNCYSIFVIMYGGRDVVSVGIQLCIDVVIK